jgi:hypothetical protein
VLGRDARDVAEARLRKHDVIAEGRQTLARPCERLGIHVETEQTYVSAARPQHCFGVATHSHRPVDHPAPAPRSQDKRDLVDEDGNVNR